MGNKICQCNQDPGKSQLLQHPWQYRYGQDMLTPRIQHKDKIKCRVHQIQINVKHCEQQLQKSGRLYKDPTIEIKQVILTGKDISQIHCAYYRPHIFIQNKESKVNRYHQIVNLRDSKISQVVIYNQGLQYFGPFLCFLAEFPELINSIIVTDANTYGLYVVAANINGKKEYLYIDDYILCQKEHPIIPLFSQVIDNKYIWPCLLQKSWMKIHGNFNRKIMNFLPQEIFQTYLSIPTKTYILSSSFTDNTLLIENHIHHKSKHARCIITTKAEPIHKIGISGRKQYYLLSHFQGQNNKWFYHFSSPCKINHFRGSNSIQNFKDYINNYSLSIQQNSFILDEQQFIQQVEQFLIVYHEKQIKNTIKQQILLYFQEQIYAKVHVPQYDHLSICFEQFSPTKLYNPLNYHVIHLKTNQCISDIDDPQACFGVKNAYLLQNIYEHVQPGDLLIRIKKRKIKNQKNRSVQNKDHIVINSQNKITIECSSEQQESYKEDFYKFLKHEGEKSLLLQKSKGTKHHDDIRYVSFWLGNLAVVYVKKINKQKTQLKLQVNFPQLKNLQCLTHPSIKKQFIGLQFPQDDLLIIFEKIDPAQETIVGKFTIQAY